MTSEFYQKQVQTQKTPCWTLTFINLEEEVSYTFHLLYRLTLKTDNNFIIRNRNMKKVVFFMIPFFLLGKNMSLFTL